MKLSFEALEALDAIDRTGTFAEAAELLHRVPSALTYLVQKLESDLGVALFDRSGRRAKLTHAGRIVVEEGRRLLRAAEQLEMKALRAQQGWETEVRVCIDEILPFDALWPYVHRFYALGMDTRLRLSTEVLGGAWDALISRRADLVVGAAGEPPELPGIVARPIGSLKHVFAVAPSHPLASLPGTTTARNSSTPPTGCSHRRSPRSSMRHPRRSRRRSSISRSSGWLSGARCCSATPHASCARTRRRASRKPRTTRSVSPKHCATSHAAPRSMSRWQAGTPVSVRPVRCCPRAGSRSARG